MQSSDSIGLYLSSIPYHPRLSKEEEARLIGCALAGRALRRTWSEQGTTAHAWSLRKKLLIYAQEAESALLEAFLPVVVRYAKGLLEVNRSRVSLEDLIAAGNEGLVLGLLHYDSSRGVRLWTCARWWVLREMNMEIRRSRWFLTITDDEYRKASLIQRQIAQHWQIFCRPPTDAELATSLGWSRKDLRDAQHRIALNDVLSLEAPAGEEGRHQVSEFLQAKPDTESDRGIDVTEGSESPRYADDALRDLMRAGLRELSDVERTVILLRYGLLQEEPKSLREVADVVKLSREGVRRIQERALRRLRESPNAARLKQLSEIA